MCRKAALAGAKIAPADNPAAISFEDIPCKWRYFRARGILSRGPVFSRNNGKRFSAPA